MCEVMQRYEEQAAKQAVLLTLISMVKDGVVTLAEAAKRVHLTEEEFEECMKKY